MRRASDGGIVHQNVQAAEFFDYLLEADFHLFGVGHVHFHGERFAARGHDLRYQRGQFFFIASSDGDFCAGFRKRQRGVATDALRGTGYQCYFVFQTEHYALTL